MKLSLKQFRWIMWGSVVLVTVISLLIWGQGLGWQFDNLTIYRLFPVLGLLAFGLMWSHYIVAALRRLAGFEKQVTKGYFSSTSLVVLALILLHPGLLILQLWRDGFGLPPNSYLEHYVAPTLEWAALLGSVSLLVFLLFELHRWFADRPWWKYIGYASDVAMIAILIHGFRLGQHLQAGWFQVVWLLYALSFAASLIILHFPASKTKKLMLG